VVVTVLKVMLLVALVVVLVEEVLLVLQVVIHSQEILQIVSQHKVGEIMVELNQEVVLPEQMVEAVVPVAKDKTELTPWVEMVVQAFKYHRPSEILLL
tara:strand:+ start:140 stop:433 length:294 start_codon:yes stop_codon:yes gene_type:complete